MPHYANTPKHGERPSKKIVRKARDYQIPCAEMGVTDGSEDDWPPSQNLTLKGEEC